VAGKPPISKEERKVVKKEEKKGLGLSPTTGSYPMIRQLNFRDLFRRDSLTDLSSPRNAALPREDEKGE
jgi:hypothetical protein